MEHSVMQSTNTIGMIFSGSLLRATRHEASKNFPWWIKAVRPMAKYLTRKENRLWHGSIMFAILLDTGLGFVGSERVGCEYDWKTIIEVCTVLLFAFEVTCCMMSAGLRRYWAHNWNRLDVFVVVCGVVRLAGCSAPHLVAVVSVGRSLRPVSSRYDIIFQQLPPPAHSNPSLPSSFP